MVPFLMGKNGAKERNESSLSNCREQPALSKKEGRGYFSIMVRMDGVVFEKSDGLVFEKLLKIRKKD